MTAATTTMTTMSSAASMVSMPFLSRVIFPIFLILFTPFVFPVRLSWLVPQVGCKPEHIEKDALICPLIPLMRGGGSRIADHAWFLPAMVILVSVWSIQKTHDFVVFCPLMIPSTTNSTNNALVLSQFFNQDLIRTLSTSVGMGAPERTCSILSRSVSLDLFGRLNIFSRSGLWPGLYPQATTIARVALDICIM